MFPVAQESNGILERKLFASPTCLRLGTVDSAENTEPSSIRLYSNNIFSSFMKFVI